MATIVDSERIMKSHETGPVGPYGNGILPTAYRALEAVMQSAMHRSYGESTAAQIEHEPFDVDVIKDLLPVTSDVAFGVEHTPEQIEQLAEGLIRGIPEGAVMSPRNQHVLTLRALIETDPNRLRSAEATVYYGTEPNAPLEYTVGDFYIENIAIRLASLITPVIKEALRRNPGALDDQASTTVADFCGTAQALGLPRSRSREIFLTVKSSLETELNPTKVEE